MLYSSPLLYLRVLRLFVMSCNCCAATDMSCRVSLSELSNSAQQPDCTQPDNIRWREDNSNSSLHVTGNTQLPNICRQTINYQTRRVKLSYWTKCTGLKGQSHSKLVKAKPLQPIWKGMIACRIDQIQKWLRQTIHSTVRQG